MQLWRTEGTIVGNFLVDNLKYVLASAESVESVKAIKEKIEWVLHLMNIGPKGYLVLFGLLFSCGLGAPIPEDIPLLVAGALVGSKNMSLLHAAIFSWCGIIGGDCVLYYLGHRFGLNISRIPVIGKHVTKARIMRAQTLFEKYGIAVVAVGRLFAGIRGARVIAAGTIKYNFLKFVIADGLAAVVSGGLFIYLGIKFGENLEYVAEKIERGGYWVFGAIALFLVIFIFWKVRSGKKEHAEKTEERIGGLDPKISDSAVQAKGD